MDAEALSIRQVAEEFGIPGGMLRRALREGSLTGHKKGRQWYVYRHDMPADGAWPRRRRRPKTAFICARCQCPMQHELWVVTRMTRREGTTGRYTIQATSRYCSYRCSTGVVAAPRRGLFGWLHG